MVVPGAGTLEWAGFVSWSEKNLHRWLERLLGRPGDDAAVLARRRARTAVCCDQTVEDVHFPRGTPAAAVGRKAVARALSDLAATGARPRAVLLALSAPARVEERWIRGAIRALKERAEVFGAALVGGDLSRTRGAVSLAVTALGSIDGAPPSRDRARPGHVVVVTGPTGGSSLGRHLRIEPRVAEGRALYRAGARAMIDVSDGLALDVSRIAEASRVRIELESVPVHGDARRLAKRDRRPAEWHALHDGEDHELVAALPRAALARARRACPRLIEIGRVARGRGLAVAGVEWDGRGGWVHGG